MCPVFHLFLFFDFLQAGISQSQARRLVTPVFRHRQRTGPSTSTACLLLNRSRHLGNRIGKPSKPTRTLEMVHRGGFSVLSPSSLRYLTVLTHPTSPVTLGYTASLPSYSATSFGLHCPRMPTNLRLPVQPVPRTSHQISHSRDYCNLCQHLPSPGHTLPWILSPAYSSQQVTTQFLLLLIISPKQHILWPYASFLLP